MDEVYELESEVQALRAELAAVNAEAERKLALWQETGDAIMETAFGAPAPLSDSDVCGLIVELRAELEALRAKVEWVVKVEGDDE